MTGIEFTKRRESIAVSDAPIEVKEAAMEKLRNEFFGSSDAVELAKRQLEESKPDTNDIGDH